MEQSFTILLSAIRMPFKKRALVVVFFASFLILMTLFVFIPVRTVPGNTVSFQLDIFSFRDYALLFLLSALAALFITMQAYLFLQRKNAGRLGTTTVGGVGALFAGIAGTAFCATCLAPLFAVFGIGLAGVLFVLEYRWYFVLPITFFLLLAIYHAAKRMNRNCPSC